MLNRETYYENQSFLVDLPVKCSHGTAEKPAKLEWSPLVGAKYYVVEMAGDDVRGDRNVFIGATTSLEIHYLTLVMKSDKKPETTQMRVSLSAMGDEIVLAQGACEKLSKLVRFVVIIIIMRGNFIVLQFTLRRKTCPHFPR